MKYFVLILLSAVISVTTMAQRADTLGIPPEIQLRLDEGGRKVESAGGLLLASAIAKIIGSGIAIGGAAIGETDAIIAGGVLAGISIPLDIAAAGTLLSAGRTFRGKSRAAKKGR